MGKSDFKVGIVGAGWIAAKAAETLNGLDGFRPYAIGSRSLEKAKAFAGQWGIEHAYGSYTEVIDNPEVDLLYVATPHSHHFDITKEAVGKGKPCLVEKAFMANKAQAQVIVDLARCKKVFLAEAIWTRYQCGNGRERHHRQCQQSPAHHGERPGPRVRGGNPRS